MSERPKNLMRSRCPACGTVFRVTSEQLRLKAGKVRCGQCRTVFNAFDQLLVGGNGQDNPPTIMPMHSTEPLTEPPRPSKAASAAKPAPARPPEPAPAPPPVFAKPGPDAVEVTQEAEPKETPEPAAQPEPEHTLEAPPEAAIREPAEQAEQTSPQQTPAGTAETLRATPLPAPIPPVPDQAPETLAQTLEAARAAGLVAAREVGDSPGYNRWSAAPVSSGGGPGDFDEPAQRPLWPYLLLALLLSFVLLGQLAYHYRTPLSLRLPALMPAYQMLGVDVPLPREASLISIEASDLQADPARGLFVLNSTLKNRAGYDQAWPQLALTLTDVNDRTVARRMISVVDYLGAQHPPAFTAGSDVGVRLWIEARDLGAAGYRLYLFYPPS